MNTTPNILTVTLAGGWLAVTALAAGAAGTGPAGRRRRGRRHHFTPFACVSITFTPNSFTMPNAITKMIRKVSVDRADP